MRTTRCKGVRQETLIAYRLPATPGTVKGQPNCAKRLECVQLARAFVAPGWFDSGSKLRAFQTLRAEVHPQAHSQVANNVGHGTKAGASGGVLPVQRPHRDCHSSYISWRR